MRLTLPEILSIKGALASGFFFASCFFAVISKKKEVG